MLQGDFMDYALNQEISQFNQDVLGFELNSAFIIEAQLKAVLEDLKSKHKMNEGTQIRLQENINEILKDLLYSSTQEQYMVHQERLNQIINSINLILNNETDLQQILSYHRFYNYLKRFLDEAQSNSSESFNLIKAPWFQEHPLYPMWSNYLENLQRVDDLNHFNENKIKLLQLVNEKSPKPTDNVLSMALVAQNVEFLKNSRLSYLESPNSIKKLASDLGWVGLGVSLLLASTLATLLFPPVGIAGLILGGISLGYGVVDYGKQTAEIYSKARIVQLGERSQNELVQLIEQQDPFLKEKQEFILRQSNPQALSERENKWIRGASYALSIGAIMLGIAGIVTVIPGIGIPIAVGFALAAVSIVMIGAVVSLVGRRLYQDRKELNILRKEVDKKIKKDYELLERVGLEDSDKYMETHLHTNHEQIKNTNSYTNQVKSHPLFTKPKKKEEKEEEEEDTEGESPDFHGG